jgi:hypothetical protein
VLQLAAIAKTKNKSNNTTAFQGLFIALKINKVSWKTKVTFPNQHYPVKVLRV